MAKGYQANQERVAILKSFGKELARRSRSKCELCETTGAALSVFEVPPESKNNPDVDRCAFLCESCHEQAGNLKRFRPGEHWRCLAQTAWSETPAVQVLAVRLLRRQADRQPWAQEALDGLFLEEPLEEWSLEAE
ncbi:MAG: hypothetical protein P1U87_14610 [Verrucomicrobiales bacterium]|nr:hypothetical protein [Verrucomicrobiales bacterium]